MLKSNLQYSTPSIGSFKLEIGRNCEGRGWITDYLIQMSLVLPEQHQQFQHILRLLNTNVDGKRKIMYALTEIKGVGRRYSNIVCKKADVDLNKR